MSLFPSFNVFLKIGSVSIHWYAICILCGAGFAYWLGQFRFKQLGYDKGILSDYFFGVLFLSEVFHLFYFSGWLWYIQLGICRLNLYRLVILVQM